MRLETPEVTERRLKLELRLAQLAQLEQCRKDFLFYVKQVWPDFIQGPHHKIIAKKFEEIL